MKSREQISAVLIHLRMKASLTQVEVGKHLGVAQGHWSRIERGRAVLTVETLLDFLEACDSDLSRFHKLLLTVQVPTKTSFKPWREVKKAVLAKRKIRE